MLGTDHVHLRDHLSVLATSRVAELALCLDTPQVESAFARPAGRVESAFARPAGRVESALARPSGRVDAAVICSSTDQHPDLVRRMVHAGIPALVEKPLAADPAGTRALTALISTAGTPVITAMFLRCAPALRRVREILHGGELGGLVRADLGFTHPGLLDGVFTGRAAWMTDPARGGSGALADLGVHLVDQLRWLRPHAPIAVRGAAAHRFPGLAVDCGGTALLDWGGVPTTLHTAWTARPGAIHVQLEGTRGTVTARDGGLVFRTRRGGGAESYKAPAAGDALTAFLATLTGTPGAWLPPTVEDIVVCADTVADMAYAAE